MKQSRRDFLKKAGLSTAALTLASHPFSCARKASQSKPNFVFFLVDDLGWVDTTVYGSTFYETPNIDRLASEGMLFTDAYAASPVCSPTRASIMTGKHPARLHITDWIGGQQKGKLLPAPYEHQLPLEEITFAEALKTAGYATGFFGKWHLGEEPYFPQYQGFDINIGGHSKGQPGSYFYPYKGRNNSAFDVPGLENGTEGEYLTDRLTDESLAFIEANRDSPFLLFLSHYAVHTPIQAKAEIAQVYEAKAAKSAKPEAEHFRSESSMGTTRLVQDCADYAAMIQSTDESLGRIVAKIDELGLSEDTIIIFTSDNGGLSTLARDRKTAPTANVPLRAGKGWLYEGGIRIPLVVRWPGVAEGGSVCHTPVMTTDFYPTLLRMAGLPLKPEQHVDGVDLTPLLRQAGALEREALYWHFPHYHGSGNRPTGAIRAGDLKFIEWFEDGRTELYNLKEDIGENRNLAAELPEKAADLQQRLAAWRAVVDARMPAPNPAWQGRDGDP